MSFRRTEEYRACTYCREPGQLKTGIGRTLEHGPGGIDLERITASGAGSIRVRRDVGVKGAVRHGLTKLCACKSQGNLGGTA
ncbi:MAG: hypothetical protein K0Q81_1046 [Paenibacillus sp.]|jgi:hypothetical protein|nr:hypothetical protein [Paenibacillus sp.]